MTRDHDLLVDFPPARHVSRDLGISYRFPAVDRVELRVPAAEAIRRPDGTARADALTTVIDEAAGFVAVYSGLPDWMSTAALQIGFLPVPATDEIVVDARVVKSGRRLAFIDAAVGSAGRRVAWASAQFARVPRAGKNEGLDLPVPDPDEIHTTALDESGFPVSYAEALGIRVLDAPQGRVELAFGSYVRNSAGILHGGVLGALSVQAAEAVGAGPVTDLNLQYLSAGRVGPFGTEAKLLASRPSDRVWRVEVRDDGHERRLMTRAAVTTAARQDDGGERRRADA